MKNVLLGSTALVGASLLAAAPVAAAEAPTLGFAGWTQVEISFSDQDLSTGRGRGYGFEVDSNYLTWSAKGTADNGMTYQAAVSMNMGGGDATTDEAKVTLASTWGTVVMGDDDGADDSMMKGGYSLLTAGYGYDGGYSAQVNLGGNASFASLVGDTGDATKVSYFTPRWSGLQIGASWTPDSGASFDNNVAGDADNDGDRENGLGLGLNYINTIGDIGVAFGTTYSRAQAESAAPFADREDIGAWSIGGTLTFSNFSVGIGHGDSGDSNCTVANVLCDQGDWWDVAARYKFGSTTIAGGFLSNEGNPAGAATGDTVDVFSVGISHAFASAPGMSAWAEYTQFEGDRVGTASDNDATYFMIGTKVAF